MENGAITFVELSVPPRSGEGWPRWPELRALVPLSSPVASVSWSKFDLEISERLRDEVFRARHLVLDLTAAFAGWPILLQRLERSGVDYKVLVGTEAIAAGVAASTPAWISRRLLVRGAVNSGFPRWQAINGEELAELAASPAPIKFSAARARPWVSVLLAPGFRLGLQAAFAALREAGFPEELLEVVSTEAAPRTARARYLLLNEMLRCAGGEQLLVLAGDDMGPDFQHFLSRVAQTPFALDGLGIQAYAPAVARVGGFPVLDLPFSEVASLMAARISPFKI